MLVKMGEKRPEDEWKKENPLVFLTLIRNSWFCMLRGGDNKKKG